MDQRSPNNSIIRLRGISRTFTGKSCVHALRDVDLDVEKGDFVSVMGPSGSGKSTLLNILGFLDFPTAGSYFYCGEDTQNFPRQKVDQIRARSVGFIFQASNVLSHRTALDNVQLGLLYCGMRRADRLAKAVAALKKVGLDNRIDAPAAVLSGGERQRVAIARALGIDPDLILADEPTGSLDTKNSRLVMDILRELNVKGATIVLITHDRDVAQAAPTQLLISDGICTAGHNLDEARALT